MGKSDSQEQKHPLHIHMICLCKHIKKKFTCVFVSVVWIWDSDEWNICPLTPRRFSLLLLAVACEIPRRSCGALALSHWLSFMQACVSLFLHSTSTRPMRTATRWFWAKGRTAWCTLGGTWATKSASPSRKSLRRTARMRTHPLFFFFCFFFPHSESLLTGKQSCTVFHKNYFFQNNPNGNGFGRGDSHWRALDPQCSLGIFGETDECLYTSFFACYSVIYTKSWSLNKRFGWRETWYLNHFLSICPTSLF